MAKLEQLLKAVDDAELKAQLEAEVASLKGRMRFGLVYERHLPETVIVGDTDGLKVGDHVRRREEANNGPDYRVVALNGASATVVPANGGMKSNGGTSKMALKDLLVVKPFGEPADAGLASLGSLRRSDERPYHAVIDGENFHVLQALTLIYEGQVDCIYIDPPYNTGARDWTYNNHFVDENDAYRHSKWLSMMEKRLRLARRLLKPDGILIVTIDEHELYHLGMLLEGLFPDYLRYKLSIVINPKGSTGTRNFGVVDEQAIYCVPNLGRDVIVEAPADNGDESEWEYQHARRRGSGTSYRHQRPRQFYPIYIDEENRRVVRAGEAIALEAEPDFSHKDGLRPIWPIDSHGLDRCWRFRPDSMQREIDAGDAVLGRHNAAKDTWTINIRRPRRQTKRVKSVWWESTHDAGTHGTELLRKFLGQPGLFPFPKSLYAVRDCLAAVVRDRPDALILDYFAGSGTTLHATCLLNAEDGGSRRCILVTNNEVDPPARKQLAGEGHYRGDPEYEKRGIFEAVTRPRVEAAISGVRPDGKPVEGKYVGGGPYADGFEENVEFFRLDYLDSDEVELDKCFNSIHPLLWLAAGGLDERPEIANDAPFLIAPECGYAVLFDEDALRDFEQALHDTNGITHVFLVTDSEEAYAEMRERLGPSVETMMLYRDFLRHFRRRLRS